MSAWLNDLFGGLSLDTILVYICAIRGITARNTGPSTLGTAISKLTASKLSKR